MSAILSPDGRLRYRLEREIPQHPTGPAVGLFGVNPSMADAVINDPTITKEIGFAVVNGWSKIIKGNLFAHRATSVGELRGLDDPRGPDNDHHIAQIIADADILVPCWGSREKLPQHLRFHCDRMMDRLLATNKPVLAWGLTRSKDPLHPLMLGYNRKLVPWTSLINPNLDLF